MLEFVKEKERLILKYTGELNSSNWIYSKIATESILLKNTFTLSSKELISEEDTNDEDAAVLFEVGKMENEYYRLSKRVFRNKNDIFIHKDIEIATEIFVAERGISIFSKLDKYVAQTIRIGGSHKDAISEKTFVELLNKFPNSYELKRYSSARIDSIISSFVKMKEEYEVKYLKYMNSRSSVKGVDTFQLVVNAEVEKYTLLFTKLKSMLASEESYSENQWQEEILQIILLLYPKYLHVFKGAPVRDTYNGKNRKIDILLVDSNGNIDIIEIKKPFDKCIVTDRTYRDNHIPLRELSGTVMQIEKYIFYLNKWGKKGEEKLSTYYRDKIGDKFSIKITNPGAIIIMGRENTLTKDQRQDFEVIKRKYKNIIDIISYDDLLERLNSTLQHWQKHIETTRKKRKESREK